MENFEATDEEKQWVTEILDAMGYKKDQQLCQLCISPEESLRAVKRELKERGLENFMESVPEGTGVRERATFKRFLQSLQEDSAASAESVDVVHLPDLGSGTSLVTKVLHGLGLEGIGAKAEEVPDLSQDARFNLTVHNISDSEDGHTLKVRVIRNCRFVEYTLMASKHAKLYLEEGSCLSVVSQNNAGGPQWHRRMSTEGLKKGGLVYASMCKKMGFWLGSGTPLPALTSGSSVYHMGGFHSDAVKFWHTEPGEEKSLFNLTELQAETSKVIVPAERSIVHLQSVGQVVRRGKHKHRPSIEDQFAAAKFRNRHVYIKKLDAFHVWTGSLLNEHEDWDAEADLTRTAQQDDTPDERFHIILHNTSPENVKDKLNVKVKSQQGQAEYKLDSHSCATLYLPQDALLEVESEPVEEWHSPKSVNVELQSLKPGANVYMRTELDHETLTPCEEKMLCFTIVLMATGAGLPLGIILMCIIGKKFKERQEKFPLRNFSHQNGPPSKGGSSASSTLWHFLGQGLDMMFASCMPGDGKDISGIALTPGESYAMEATGDAFEIAIRECRSENGGRGGIPELEETTRKRDHRDTGNFTNRHVYVNVRKTKVGKVGMEILPGSLLKGNHLCWDASKDFKDSVQLALVVEDNEVSNISNVPEGKVVVGEP